MANIKQVLVGSTTYEIEALHFFSSSTLDTPAQWKQYIDDIGAAASKIQIVVDQQASGKEEPATAASASTMGKIYLVAISGTESGTYTEFITIDKGSGTPRYVWEKIGTTATDLSEYAKKGDYNTSSAGATTTSGPSYGTTTAITATGNGTYKKADASTGSAGGHNHTVTAPTGSFVTGVKASGGTTNAVTGITTSGDTFVKSYPGVTSYLKTGSVTGVSGSTIASKATAGEVVTVATRASSQTTVGNANVGTAVSFTAVNTVTDVTSTNVASPTLTSVVGINSVTAGSDASLSAGAQAQWTATVDGTTLKFGFTPNTLQTLTGGKATVVSTVTVSNIVKSNATTPSVTAVTATKVTTTDKSIAPAVASETKIYGVGGTVNITPYSFTDVTVPKAASSTNFVTGLTTTAATGMGVLTGLGTASTATALTSASASGSATVILSTGLTASTAVTSVTLADAPGHTHSVTSSDATVTVSVPIVTHTHTVGNHTHSVTI